ncbi:MAG: response regulator [Eubacterium sp.]|nr:response regulator [Eubacterium sp.]
MKIAVVDDLQLYRDRAKSCIINYYRNEIINIDFYESGEEYLESEIEYDISFIDIEMNGIDGFETIKKARKRYPESVYMILTTHTEMCDRGYLVNAFRYINKERMEELIIEALESAETLLERNKRIKVNIVGEGVREITLKDISYVEGASHNVIVHMKHEIKGVIPA